MIEQIIEDKEKLIRYSVDFADKMLTQNQEFYPFAATINLNGDLEMESYFDGDDHPESQELIYKLEHILEKQLNNKEKRSFALTYDVKVKKDDASEKSDAVAIKIRHIETEEIIIYYYAYKLTKEKKIEFFDCWGTIS